MPLRRSFRQLSTAANELVRLQSLEVGHRLEAPVALIYLAVLKGSQAVEAEILDIEGGHDAAEDDRLPDPVLRNVPGVRQVPHETAGKGIARPGRIEDFFQRIRRSGKDRILGKEQHPVLAAL